jgi:6-pyruvoyl-tetrahydropterin synthase
MYRHLEELPTENIHEEELNMDVMQEQLPINFTEETDGSRINPDLLPAGEEEDAPSSTVNDEDKEGIIILDDKPTQTTNDLLLKHIIDADPEEIIINGQYATFADHNPITENVKMQLEDGTYKELPTEEVYNYMEETTQQQEISRYIALKYSDTLGKLYVQVELTSGDEEIYDANKSTSPKVSFIHLKPPGGTDPKGVLE